MKPRCGVKYTVGVHAPKHARFAVYFWDFVIYHTRKLAAENTVGSLGYYEAEDAQIINLSRKANHAFPNRSRMRKRSRTRNRYR